MDPDEVKKKNGENVETRKNKEIKKRSSFILKFGCFRSDDYDVSTVKRSAATSIRKDWNGFDGSLRWVELWDNSNLYIKKEPQKLGFIVWSSISDLRTKDIVTKPKEDMKKAKENMLRLGQVVQKDQSGEAKEDEIKLEIDVQEDQS
ncbi:hypothetical protein RHSIM_Rhsim01G0122700 [Rhododendron simsii]|uniref:Uncharacterized protein n=1 Tax=Rhododendron simsii TaxID=118357 RepID=A0A834HDB1_RHOSS|nr:hypothetical protein RHSIM_Rhsim01G0122700 [Rhododendron simsii]